MTSSPMALDARLGRKSAQLDAEHADVPGMKHQEVANKTWKTGLVLTAPKTPVLCTYVCYYHV